MAYVRQSENGCSTGKITTVIIPWEYLTDMSLETKSCRQVQGDVHALPYIAVIAVTFTLGSILLATILSPEFVWTEHALSNLGIAAEDAGTQTTVLLFNGGLITGGIIGVVFAVSVGRRVERRSDMAVVALTGLTLACMGLVGVFPQGEPLHYPVAVAFFLLISVALWAESGVSWRSGERQWALLSFAGGSANILTWVVWMTVRSDPFRGIAIPELIGAIIFGGWLCLFAVRMTR